MRGNSALLGVSEFTIFLGSLKCFPSLNIKHDWVQRQVPAYVFIPTLMSPVGSEGEVSQNIWEVPTFLDLKAAIKIKPH